MKTNIINEKNLILITIDCLRADHLHCMGYPKGITSTIDALTKNGIIFTNAIANAPYTSYSIPSFLTSTMPPIRQMPKVTLADVLKKNGYTTAAFNPNPIVFSTIVGGGMINKGFDTYEIMLSTKKHCRLILGFIRHTIMRYFRAGFNENGWIYKTMYSIYDKAIKLLPTILCPKQHLCIPVAEDINRQAINWIRKQKSKFFIWLHYMDAHEPYAPLGYKNQDELLYLITKYSDFPEMLTKQEIEKLIILYDLEIEYTDKAINSLFKKLQELDYFDNSIIIISSDHGETFGEHGTLGHGGKLGKFKEQLYDESIHVPLIIHGLGKKRLVIDRQVQLLDLAPTICKLLNIPIPPSFFGRNLFTSSGKGVIVNSQAYLGYRTEHYKLIINKSDDKKNELYDLKKDPKEKINIYNEKQEFTAKLESEMISVLKNYKKKKEMLDVKFNH